MNAAVNQEYIKLKQAIIPAYQRNVKHDGETLHEVIYATAGQTGIELDTVEQVVCDLLDISPEEIQNKWFPSEIDR